MSKPLYTTFLAEVENLAEEYDLEMSSFVYNQEITEKGHERPALLNIKFRPKEEKGNE